MDIRGDEKKKVLVVFYAERGVQGHNRQTKCFYYTKNNDISLAKSRLRIVEDPGYLVSRLSIFSCCSPLTRYSISFAFAVPPFIFSNKKNADPYNPLPAMLLLLFTSATFNLCSNDLLNSTLLLNSLRRLGVDIRVILHHTLQLVSSLLQPQLNSKFIFFRRGFEYA